MADINLTVQSLLTIGRTITVTISETATVAQLKSAIASIDLLPVDIMILSFNNEVLEDTDTLDSLGIQNNDYIRTANTIAHLLTKEDKQVAKLELAGYDRESVANPRALLDINLLPSVYSGNEVVPNPHPDGLQLGRPWLEGVPGPEFPVVTTDLQLYYDATIEESYPGSGDTWVDLMGNANSNLISSPNFIAGPPSALSFDGVADYATTPNVDGVNTFSQNDDYSIEFWVNIAPTQNASEVSVCEKTGGPGYPYVIRYVQSNGRLVTGAFDPTSGGRVLVFPVPNNQWIHVAIVYDFSNTQLRAYVNGVRRPEVNNSLSYPPEANIKNGGPLDIMRRDFTRFLKGDLGAFRIYSKALTDEEVTQNYDAEEDRYIIGLTTESSETLITEDSRRIII